MQEAKWMIKNIQQRFTTILRVSQAIVDRQRNFLEYGEVAMKPLVLREIADELELHESTISRVTNNKYMLTPVSYTHLDVYKRQSLPLMVINNANMFIIPPK